MPWPSGLRDDSQTFYLDSNDSKKNFFHLVIGTVLLLSPYIYLLHSRVQQLFSKVIHLSQLSSDEYEHPVYYLESDSAILITSNREDQEKTSLLLSSGGHESTEQRKTNSLLKYRAGWIGYGFAILLLFLPIVPAIILKSVTPEISATYFFVELSFLLLYIGVLAIIGMLTPGGCQSFGRYDIPMLLFLWIHTQIENFYPNFIIDSHVCISHRQPTWPCFSLLRMTSFNIACTVYIVFRGLTGIGGILDLSLGDIRKFVVAMLVFFVPVASLGFSTHSFTYQKHITFTSASIELFLIMFLLAIPITLFFNGITQDLIMKRLAIRGATHKYTSIDQMDSDETNLLINSSLGQRNITFSKDGRRAETTYRKWLNLPTKADWVANIASSLFYTIGMLDYHLQGNSAGTVAMSLFCLFWLGLCRGWLWSKTQRIILPALLHTLAHFLGITLLGFKSNALQWR